MFNFLVKPKYFLKKLLRFIFNNSPKALKYSLYRKLFKIPQDLPHNVEFKIAETKEELEAAFKLLHNAYVEVGLMTTQNSGMRVTVYHSLPSSTTLIGKIGEEVVATVTIIRDNIMGLPCDSLVDLSHIRQGGDRIAEISALAIKRGHRGKLLFHLLKFMYESCANYLGVDHLIATLTTDTHSNELYESILFFKPIDAKLETNYAFSNFRPVIVEHLNLSEAFDIFKKHYSGQNEFRNLFNFFFIQQYDFNKFPERKFHAINYPVMNSDNFKYFLVDKTNVLNDMSIKQLLALKIIYQDQPPLSLINEVLKGHEVNTCNIRNDARFELSNKTMGISKGGFLSIRLLDVSRTGLRVSSQEMIGELVEIIVIDHNGKTAYLKAKKMWQDGHGVCGLSITKADDNWNEMINFYERTEMDKENIIYFKKAS